MDLTLDSGVHLRSGTVMPRLGLGVFRSGAATREAVLWALEAGYRHIDTAAIYGNETEVGQALRDSGLPRDEVFVTTKLWNDEQGRARARGALENSLEALGLDYVDLYLLHWPVPEHRLESWRVLERARRDGLCRAIGVSNFMVSHLDELVKEAEDLPAVNQIELHPFCQQWDVVRRCHQLGIVVEAYSPLTKGQKLDHPLLAEVAAELGRSPAQVLIRWGLERGLVVLPKSANRDRIRENADVFDFWLTAEQLGRLDGLDESLHTAWDPTGVP